MCVVWNHASGNLGCIGVRFLMVLVLIDLKEHRYRYATGLVLLLTISSEDSTKRDYESDRATFLCKVPIDLLDHLMLTLARQIQHPPHVVDSLNSTPWLKQRCLAMCTGSIYPAQDSQVGSSILQKFISISSSSSSVGR